MLLTTFQAWETLQRSALLQVKVSGASPNNLIYVPFGFGVGEEKANPYHGWVFGYDGSLTQQVSFVTTAKGWGSGSNTDSPACTANCTCSGTSCTAGAGCIASGYVFAPNWCGHAGGVWMSGRGGAANPDSSGNSHAYFGVGNGAFQQRDSTGALLGSIQNWGNSILDFTLSSSGGTYQTPSEYFTPYGGSSVPLQATLLGNESGGNPVDKTVQGLNQNDLDISASGILLFDDLSSNHRLVTGRQGRLRVSLNAGQFVRIGERLLSRSQRWRRWRRNERPRKRLFVRREPCPMPGPNR
jgi:hypothetical protein